MLVPHERERAGDGRADAAAGHDAAATRRAILRRPPQGGPARLLLLALGAGACATDLEVGTTEPPVAPLPEGGQSVVNDPKDVPPSIPREEFLARYSTAICGGLETCCTVAGLDFDDGACERFVTRDGLRQDAPRVTAHGPYDPIAAAECVARMSSPNRRCSTPSVPFDAASWTALRRERLLAAQACARVVPGTAAPGERCERDGCAPGADPLDVVQCMPSTNYDPALPFEDQPATCRLRRWGAGVGEPCTAVPTPRQTVTQHCGDYLLYEYGDPVPPLDGVIVCDVLTSTCQPASIANAPAGSECTENKDCRPGAYCARPSVPELGLPSRCATYPTSGLPCLAGPVQGDPTTGWRTRCAADAFCDSETDLCTARKLDGEPCSDHGECLGSCIAGVCGPDIGFASAASCDGSGP